MPGFANGGRIGFLLKQWMSDSGLYDHRLRRVSGAARVPANALCGHTHVNVISGEIMVCLSWRRLSLALVFLVLVSCTVTPPPPPPALPPALTLPTPAADKGPAIPFRDPNVRGDVQLTVEPFTDRTQLEACLALGQPVYGITLQNTNVRMAPTLNACRVGRIPRGTLVEITGMVTTTNGLQIAAVPVTATSTSTTTAVTDPITTTLAVTGAAVLSLTAGMTGFAGITNVLSTAFTTALTSGITATITATDAPSTTLAAVTATITPTVTAELPGTIPAVQPVNQAEPTPLENILGYTEDIQPIFERTCIACHSGVVQQLNLQVTTYEGLMRGSLRGPVVAPGDAQNSVLWQMISTGKMPMIGQLTLSEKDAVRRWIEEGARQQRPVPIAADALAAANAPRDPDPAVATAITADLWLTVAAENIDSVPDSCAVPPANPQQVVSADLILPISCGLPPSEAQLQNLLRALALVPTTAAAVATDAAGGGTDLAVVVPNEESVAPDGESLAPDVEVVAPAAAAPPRAAAPQVGLQAAALGLPAPSDGDGWLTPRGGFCLDQHLAQNDRGITALTFAPDGRLFMALDSRIDGQPDTNILYDAFHPSRSIAIYDPNTRYTPQEIMAESTRITGMAYANGALFISRAGEVGWLPDGGVYRPLAGGFAVNSQLFHANNGLVISGGYVYVSAGGVRDGYSDGPIEGIGEAGAQDVVSGGNRFAARLLRAPLDRLINEFSINVFETAARGLRNPYGVAVDPSGRIWFTDNGATNVPENVSAGDEVNLFDPGATPPGTPEDATPYYGFPLALTSPQSWYTGPVVDLLNTSAPTGLTWAYGTIFFGQYGRNPGLYRIGRTASGVVIAERVMLVWPLLATTTAPDGALWIGTGGGGLYRMTPGC